MILNKSLYISLINFAYKKINRTKFFSSILITMLNLFDKKIKNTSFDISNTRALTFFSDTANDITNQNNIGETRHYPPATKEWFNSIYSYNPNFIKTLPIVDKIVNKLVKSYFNLSPLYNNKKSSRVQVRFKRLSLNRILVSRAEMKHTNNKVIITVYLYNKNQKFFLYKLKTLYKTFLFRVCKKIPSLALNVGQGLASHTKSTANSNGLFALKTVKKNPYKPLATTTKKTLSKFSSKRLKKNHRFFTRNKAIKTNYYINFTNLSQKNLSKFLFNLKNTGLKTKYKTLISKYYYLLSNNKLNTINNNNYYLNYVNLAKSKSSVNSDCKRANLYTSNLYESALKKNSFFSTRRDNNSYKLLDDNKVGARKKTVVKPFETVFALNKSRKPRNIKNFLNKLRNLHKLFFISKMYNLNQTNNVVLNNSNEKSNFLLKNLHFILKNKSTLIRKINYISLKGLRILKKARKNKNFLLKTLKWNNKNFINYETKYYKNFINKSYRKEILYLYYVKMLSLNNNKFKNWFILGLKRIISKLYHKKVEFNFVNLKYLHLNSDIFSESIAIKLRNRENRLLRVLKKALKLVKLPSLNKLSFYDKKRHNKSGFALNKYETLNLNSYISIFKDKDILHELLYKIFPRYMDKIESAIYSQRKNSLQENILNTTKHKNIYGVRLEAHGRLSRRLTASRSVFKLKYKGSLKNIDSSYKSLSSVMLRGNTKSNIQLTKISSKTRNGSFGLKGWISSN